MKIKDLLSNSLEAWADFGLIPGFSVKLAFLSRSELNKIRKMSSTQEYSHKTRTVEDKIDEDAFIENFCKQVILDWKGLTTKGLTKLIITADIEEDQVVDYSLENAVTLLTQSPTFDEWVNEVTFSIDSFRSSTKEENSGSTTKVSKG